MSDSILTVAQLFAAVVTAIATFMLWRVTNVLAQETHTLAASASRPFVIVYLRSSDAGAILFDIVFENTGNAPAFDVDALINPAPKKMFQGSLAKQDEKMMSRVSMIPPGVCLPRRSANGPDIDGVVYKITVSWSEKPGSNKRESLSYQFEAKDGFRAGTQIKGLHQLTAAVEKIEENEMTAAR